MMAAQYIPANMLGVTDDCGFQPFSNDPRPNYGSPDIARDVAFKKITARLEGGPNGVGEAGSLVPTSLRNPARRT